ACEPTACPTLTRGKYHYDFGDTAQLTPLVKMHTLGHTFVPAPIHAGGLRYHGDSPQLSLLVEEGLIAPRAFQQIPCFEAAVQFARSEGFLPAPETSHALRGAIDEALKCKETGEEKCIVVAYSGHGHFDLAAYEKYFADDLAPFEYSQEKLDEALTHLPSVDFPPAE
ncbi:MAG TPA: TrpB-like pyridoxal-phosphate dependent enzyme, partial [Armatimonadota bacterium]|nr:TrpB-like pyridoxal-phosphate dependent enzyme [Armatimonadota bacterium]